MSFVVCVFPAPSGRRSRVLLKRSCNEPQVKKEVPDFTNDDEEEKECADKREPGDEEEDKQDLLYSPALANEIYEEDDKR